MQNKFHHTDLDKCDPCQRRSRISSRWFNKNTLAWDELTETFRFLYHPERDAILDGLSRIEVLDFTI